ncbi:MAG: acylphosphatase [Patescibacteria group bacterium UBA2103]
MKKRVRIIASGRVQLVMYRDFTRRKAKGLGVTGWVKNLKDNTVEVLAEGEEEDLKVLIKHLWNGPLLAEVEDLDIKWWNGATGEFKTFEITYEK